MYAKTIIDQLKDLATQDRRKTTEFFFKTGKEQYSEHDQFIGVSMTQTRQVAKRYFKDISFTELGKLINHPTHEIRHCGLIILVNKYQYGDKKNVYEYYLKNISSVNNWDLVDTTTPYIIGDYIYHHQDQLFMLFDYSHSTNLWEKRIAIVATFAFIKQGKFNPTLVISKSLLDDSHDLIHKAVGWMLREIYKKDEALVKLFIRENYSQLPRTTLRYAIERMNENERLIYLRGEF